MFSTFKHIKHWLPIVVFVVTPHAVAADITGVVTDHFDYVTQRLPTTTQECFIRQVPIYSEHSSDRQFGDMVMGAVIGSAIGNAISDKDGVGTLGGVIGAHQASKNRSGEQIIGYRDETVCEPKTVNEQRHQRIYSHSTVEFWLDGRRYRIRFDK